MASTYIKDDQGGTFIPASQRPDGTWRKPRRVKDGYIPQEEVPLYESKGKQFVKNKPTLPVGYTPTEYTSTEMAKRDAQAKKSTIPGASVQNVTKKKKKKSKSKAVDALSDSLEKTTITKPNVNNKQKAAEKPAQTAITNSEPNVDPLKRLNRLRKKIREIEALAQKIKSGEIKNPDKEMLEKVSKKAEVETEIKQLESCQ